jgi:hypothetical protein
MLELPLMAYADLIVYPTDDAWTDLNVPDNNYNNSAILIDYTSTSCVNTRIGYLRLNIAAIYKDVGGQTKLRVYVAGPPIKAGGSISLWSTGDDWNDATAGLGGETTLTWNNAPALVTSLDTQPISTSPTWIEFSGAALSNYINSQRTSNGGDDLVSFGIQWQVCVDQDFDLAVLEDRENTMGTGNEPELVPLGPLAVTLLNLEATSVSSSPLAIIFVAVVIVVIALTGGLIWERRRRHA